MDYSYMGAGQAYLREYGSAAPFLPIGNASAVNFGVTENAITLQDYTQPGGGVYNEVKRVESVDVNITMHDLSPANLAMAFFGTTTAVVAGTATAEAVTAYKGGFTPLANLPTAITTVTGPGGTPSYVEGTDYEFRPGGLHIPATSTIPAPVDGAANLAVTYEYGAQDTMAALTQSAKDYEMLFVGLNEARSGKPARVRAYRVKFGPAQALALVSADEHAALEVSGKVQADTSRTGVGVSRYFDATLVA